MKSSASSKDRYDSHLEKYLRVESYKLGHRQKDHLAESMTNTVIMDSITNDND